MAKASNIRLRLKPSQVRPFSMDGATMDDLAMLGLQFPDRAMRAMAEAYSMDTIGPVTINAASAGVPVQFLQTLLPGTVRAVTAARKIDAIVGRTIAGNWEDEEIVQTIVELTGQARPYGDYSPAPLGNYKVDFERRTVVRFAMDLDVPVLEEERAARIRQNSGELKRSAAAQALAIEHNAVGFFGYNDGENRTYGFLNDPFLPDYKTLPPGASGSSRFQDKTFLEILDDLLIAASTIRVQTGELVEPDRTPIAMVISASARDFLNVSNDHGMTVKEWIRENYPNWRIESAIELDGANGGANVFYFYAEELAGQDDGGGTQKVIDQYVPTTLRMIGVERQARGVYEVYSSATAGIMVKVPVAITRFSGV